MSMVGPPQIESVDAYIAHSARLHMLKAFEPHLTPLAVSECMRNSQQYCRVIEEAVKRLERERYGFE